MKTWWIAVLVAAMTVPAMAAPSMPEKVRVTATKKTAASRKGPQQSLPNVSGRVEEDEVFYRFELQRIAMDVPQDLRIQYMVVVQDAAGQLRAGAAKEEEVVLEALRPVAVESETVTLKKIEWNRAGLGTGALKEKLYGWAVRVTDGKGTILTEKFQPKDLETQMDRLLEQWRKTGGEAPARPLRPAVVAPDPSPRVLPARPAGGPRPRR
ncbi:MAG: hypothetical protein FJ221_14030 [Lentisphaerae bacterium]|nr:hypothetical protein [Lentisphaerota bacterium]